MIKSDDAAAWRLADLTPETPLPDFKIAPYFGVSKHVIKRWGKDGKIPVHRYKKVGKRYTIAEVSRFVANDLPRILENQPKHSKGNWRKGKTCEDPTARAVLYGVFDPKDNQCVYVGYTVNMRARWAEHRNALKKNQHQNRQLQSVWNKRGRLTFRVLQEGMARLMLHAEVEAVAKLRAKIGSRLCNATSGGEGACGKTEAVKKSIANKSKAAWESPEYRRRYAKARGKTPEEIWGDGWRTVDMAKQRAIAKQTAMLAKVGRLLNDIRKACEPSPKRLHKQDFVWPTLGNETFVPLSKGAWAAVPHKTAAWAMMQGKWCIRKHHKNYQPKAVRGDGTGRAAIMQKPWRIAVYPNKNLTPCQNGT